MTGSAKNLFVLFCILLNAKFIFAMVPPIELSSERHRTEWNWVEYRLTLKNISSETIFNPEIRYFAKGTEFDATFYSKNAI